jgi:hypothetical protein
LQEEEKEGKEEEEEEEEERQQFVRVRAPVHVPVELGS